MSIKDSAVRDAIVLLRKRRDALPRVPAYSCYCGNITGPHQYRTCGQPTTMWSRDAWSIEHVARRLEREVTA